MSTISRTAVAIDVTPDHGNASHVTDRRLRARPQPTVSTPLTWDEVHAGVDRRDFTLRTLPARLARVGDLWARLRTGPSVDLGTVLDRLGA